jgi:hypothetical protein
MAPMNPRDFLTSMETVLHTRPVEFSRASLIAFVESSWSLIEDNPAPAFWCERFLEGVDLCAPA